MAKGKKKKKKKKSPKGKHKNWERKKTFVLFNLFSLSSNITQFGYFCIISHVSVSLCVDLLQPEFFTTKWNRRKRNNHNNFVQPDFGIGIQFLNLILMCNQKLYILIRFIFLFFNAVARSVPARLIKTAVVTRRDDPSLEGMTASVEWRIEKRPSQMAPIHFRVSSFYFSFIFLKRLYVSYNKYAR